MEKNTSENILIVIHKITSRLVVVVVVVPVVLLLTTKSHTNRSHVSNYLGLCVAPVISQFQSAFLILSMIHIIWRCHVAHLSGARTLQAGTRASMLTAWRSAGRGPLRPETSGTFMQIYDNEPNLHYVMSRDRELQNNLHHL